MKKKITLILSVFLILSVYGMQIGENTVSEVFESVKSSVVNLDTVIYIERKTPVYSFGDPFLDRFFGGALNNPRFFKNNVIPRQGLGTGVIISEKGFLITNAHVIENQNAKIKITFHDESEADGEVVGLDKVNDIAVVKFNPDEAGNFSAIEIGDSDKLNIGQWVVAIGSPFGLQQTVTVGVVSALNRNLPVDRNNVLQNLIQTDASINPGNSGGPLVNLKGELVGINTAIIPMGQGLGFAIPVNSGIPVFKNIMEHGRHIYPYLGVYLEEIDINHANQLRISGGVLINDVLKNSPAERDGLKKGDIVIMADENHIKDSNELAAYIKGKSLGSSLYLTILRDGKRIVQKIKLDEPAENNNS
ncbi:MAG: S1C family serine protease [Candidatus Muiribacteriota bacterium]